MIRTLLSGCLTAAILCLIPPVSADSYPVILSGKVTLPDGSPPPIQMGLERVCSDNQGSGPGPLTNKKGEYIWRLDVDPLASRACFIRATGAGYASTTVDVSALPGVTTTNIKLDPIIVTPKGADPEQVVDNEDNIPAKARTPWKAAMKALDSGNFPETARQLQAAVQAVPKFAQGWHVLGVLLNQQQKPADARDAFEHAIAADPKYIAAYVSLARVCIRTKDWEGAAKAADAEIKADSKHVYIEIYLHQAVARYQMKDLDGAAASVQQCMTLDKTHALPRAEYIQGRILEAKGDLDGARQHMTHYLEVDKAAKDAALIKAHIGNLGKAGAADPDLEVL
jgi:Tfp pilus assembly protein PilF